MSSGVSNCGNESVSQIEYKSRSFCGMTYSKKLRSLSRFHQGVCDAIRSTDGDILTICSFRIQHVSTGAPLVLFYGELADFGNIPEPRRSQLGYAGGSIPKSRI